MPTNQQIVLDNRPQGEATVDNFKLVTTDTPALKDGQVLVQAPLPEPRPLHARPHERQQELRRFAARWARS